MPIALSKNSHAAAARGRKWSKKIHARLSSREMQQIFREGEVSTHLHGRAALLQPRRVTEILSDLKSAKFDGTAMSIVYVCM